MRTLLLSVIGIFTFNFSAAVFADPISELRSEVSEKLGDSSVRVDSDFFQRTAHLIDQFAGDEAALKIIRDYLAILKDYRDADDLISRYDRRVTALDLLGEDKYVVLELTLLYSQLGTLAFGNSPFRLDRMSDNQFREFFDLFFRLKSQGAALVHFDALPAPESFGAVDISYIRRLMSRFMWQRLESVNTASEWLDFVSLSTYPTPGWTAWRHEVAGASLEVFADLNPSRSDLRRLRGVFQGAESQEIAEDLLFVRDRVIENLKKVDHRFAKKVGKVAYSEIAEQSEILFRIAVSLAATKYPSAEAAVMRLRDAVAYMANRANEIAGLTEDGQAQEAAALVYPQAVEGMLIEAYRFITNRIVEMDSLDHVAIANMLTAPRTMARDLKGLFVSTESPFSNIRVDGPVYKSMQKLLEAAFKKGSRADQIIYVLENFAMAEGSQVSAQLKADFMLKNIGSFLKRAVNFQMMVRYVAAIPGVNVRKAQKIFKEIDSRNYLGRRMNDLTKFALFVEELENQSLATDENFSDEPVDTDPRLRDWSRLSELEREKLGVPPGLVDKRVRELSQALLVARLAQGFHLNPEDPSYDLMLATLPDEISRRLRGSFEIGRYVQPSLLSRMASACTSALTQADQGDWRDLQPGIYYPGF